MPLIPGKAGIGQNIQTEQAAGKKHSQAVAIALSEARRTGANIPPPKKKGIFTEHADRMAKKRGK